MPAGRFAALLGGRGGLWDSFTPPGCWPAPTVSLAAPDVLGGWDLSRTSFVAVSQHWFCVAPGIWLGVGLVVCCALAPVTASTVAAESTMSFRGMGIPP